MTVKERKDTCINAGKIYYEYLSDNDRGIRLIEVTSIEQINAQAFKLIVKQKIVDTQGLIFRVLTTNKEYSTDKVKVLQYDADKRILLIGPSEECEDDFSTLTKDTLLLVSDLKFLVQRVIDWY